MKKTIKAVIILVLLLPFYLISSQQSIKKSIQKKAGVGPEFVQKFPELCFTLASSDIKIEPIFVSRESMSFFPCFQQQEQNNFILPDATRENLLDFHKYLVFFSQQKNKDAKQGGFHFLNPVANLSKYMQEKSPLELLKITQYALLVFPAEEPFGLTDLWAKTIQEKQYSSAAITELFNTVKISESISQKIYEAAVSSSKNILHKRSTPKEVCWVPNDSNLKVIDRKEPREIIATSTQLPELMDDVALKLKNERVPKISSSIKENEIINGFFLPRKWFVLNPIKLMIQIGSIGLLPLAFCVCKYILHT